jgi:hypothetical protein
MTMTDQAIIFPEPLDAMILHHELVDQYRSAFGPRLVDWISAFKAIGR